MFTSIFSNSFPLRRCFFIFIQTSFRSLFCFHILLWRKKSVRKCSTTSVESDKKINNKTSKTLVEVTLASPPKVYPKKRGVRCPLDLPNTYMVWCPLALPNTWC
uniref:Uncharacterized protein n=1 Tax=Cacopsylla melanoneura TaxID=428564 RepID=A0A8D8Z3Q0_9HEMI